jgi:hypothetical protein
VTKSLSFAGAHSKNVFSFIKDYNMYLSSALKRVILLGIIFLTLKICNGQVLKPRSISGASKMVVFKPTGYEKIMKMHREYANGPHPLPADDSIIKDSRTIRSAPTDTLVAVIGWTGRKLSVDVYPNTTTIGTAIKVRGRQGALVEKIKSINRVPADLDDFPIQIKIDKAAFDSIWKYTKCQSFLFFPSIENGWERNSRAESHPHTKHFTLSILGSEPTNDHISHLHTGGQLFLKDFKIAKALDKLVDGAETWPYESFTWANIVTNQGK